MNRRQCGAAATAAAAALVAGGGGRALAANRTDDKMVQASKFKAPPMHKGRKPEVGMLLYPGVTLLDLVGPQTVLAPSCNVHLVWKNTDLLESDSGVVLKPTCTFAACPKDLDALFVPGGSFEVMEDAVRQEILTLCAVSNRESGLIL